VILKFNNTTSTQYGKPCEKQTAHHLNIDTDFVSQSRGQRWMTNDFDSEIVEDLAYDAMSLTLDEWMICLQSDK
jgi:hypothetical protein